MGSGDLNTKKSWHVDNLRNQKKVWESEQAALAERKKVNERLEELRKERQEEEIAKQLEAAGGKKRVDRVEWMYQSPSGGHDASMVTEEAEAFLLGKRRIDSLLTGDDHKAIRKSAIDERFASVGAPGGDAGSVGALNTIPTSARDLASKIRDDPLLAIKRQEQAALLAMAKDPLRRQAMMAAMAHKDGQRDRSRDRRDRSRGRHSRRDRSREGRERERREGREHRHRRRDSPDRARERRSSRERRHDDERGRRDERERGRRDRHEKRDERPRQRSRSRSPRRDRSHRPYRQDRQDRQDDRTGKTADDERARRLAAMQANANDLDAARSRRMAEVEAKEAAARAADEAERVAAERNGTSSFGTALRQRVGDMGLAERLGRSRQGLQRDEE